MFAISSLGRQGHVSDTGISSGIHSSTLCQESSNTTVKSAWHTLPATPAVPSLHTPAQGLQLTPQSSTQDLRVEFLLVFTDFWAVTLWADVGWIDVDNRALPCIFPPDRLRFGTRCWNERHTQLWKM